MLSQSKLKVSLSYAILTTLKHWGEGLLLENQNFDVIIVGAGISGVLSAIKMNAFNPEYKILILEKDSEIAGRLRTSGLRANRWSCGLNRVTNKLVDFSKETFAKISPNVDFTSFCSPPLSNIGILSGGKIVEISATDIFEEKGAKALGGLAAQRDWGKVSEVFNATQNNEEALDLPFSKSWKAVRKNPAAIVMEHYASCFGITDIWSSTLRSLIERSEELKSVLYTARWEDAFDSILSNELVKSNITLQKNCQVVGAAFHDSIWSLKTAKGIYSSKKLVVAHSPWQALDWLPKDLWPAHLLEFALKTRPVSVVVLTSLITKSEPLPDLTLITSENVHVTVAREKEITFQTAIDFEISLDAPEVVKAVKRLKRARKKLMKSVEGLELEFERLELLPIGWTQSTDSSDRRYLSKIEKKPIHSNHLYFCGDAYGPSYAGDSNLIASIQSMCEAINK